jgi:hypothetical protein
MEKGNFDEFKSRGLHEEHAVLLGKGELSEHRLI